MLLLFCPLVAVNQFVFQLPALLQTGLTLVVSPLVALMENQVNQFKTSGTIWGIVTQ